MDPTDLDSSLANIFCSQMSMIHNKPALELQTNEEESQNTIPLTLLIKPFGFKPPPPKAIIPRLLQAWNTKNRVTIAPKKYTDDLQEVAFDSVTFWIQIRGIPPEMLSTENINKLAEFAGNVIEIDWKDTPTLPKWYVTPRALVRVPVAQPLCPGQFINRKSSSATWVCFKYEHLKTFCYDCGLLGHDQNHCTSDLPAPPNLYGPWLHFDNQTDIPPPLITATPASPQPATPPPSSPPPPPQPTHPTRPESPSLSHQNRTNPQIAQYIDDPNHPIFSAPLSLGKDSNPTRTKYPAKIGHNPTVGSVSEADESSFLRRSNSEPSHPTRASRKAARSKVIYTDSIYSGLIDEQVQTEAQFQIRHDVHPNPNHVSLKSDHSPCPNWSPYAKRITSIKGLSPSQRPGPGSSSSRMIKDSPQLNVGGKLELQHEAELIIPQRKMKNGITVEEFLYMSAPYANFLNKMAKTFGDTMQQDWNLDQQWDQPTSFQSSKTWVAQNVLMPMPSSEMEEETIPEDFQMAEEAGLIKPPRKP
ncbi:hypothetical protein CRG98_043480 [Punica granatum]|uniref:CCHC-type domain-containing protein n=1 Tax=Punica granatum TaxID=22663 RepID=A0A2I0HWR7_PUNGR|nr:hypothetical protein CRG98_043480 [Punica granatum]